MPFGDDSGKPRILLAACGCVAAVQFGHICKCFSEWAEVKAVATDDALSFIDRATIPEDVVLYTDEDDWRSWGTTADGILHIQLRRWAEILVIAPVSANTLAKVNYPCDFDILERGNGWFHEGQMMLIRSSLHTLLT